MYLIIYGFLKICDNRENTVRQINILKAEAQAVVQTQEALMSSDFPVVFHVSL